MSTEHDRSMSDGTRTLPPICATVKVKADACVVYADLVILRAWQRLCGGDRGRFPCAAATVQPDKRGVGTGRGHVRLAR